MEPHEDPLAREEGSPILDRTDTGGRGSRTWPLIALALIGLMLVRACVSGPGPGGTPPAPPAATAPSSR